MGRPKKNPAEETEKQDAVTPESQLSAYLQATKEFHHSLEDDVFYRISGDSMKLDLATSGGLIPGVHRFCGVTEGGKTSCALTYMKNFLKTVQNSRGVIVKAEGRLTPEMKKRSGVPFVEKFSEWKNGTCFVFDCNVYETAMGLMRELIANNPAKTKYCFILDSVDALVPQGDMTRDFTDANKVAGGALLSSDFLRKMALALAKRGHMAILISQIRAEIKVNAYAKTDPRVVGASGGNALLHYPNFIYEFLPRFKADIITENDDEKGEMIGHFCKLVLRKTTNEKTGETVRYPIRHGQTNGNSVWQALEVIDMLLMWEMIQKKGAWFTPTDSLLDEVKALNKPIDEQNKAIVKENQEIEKENKGKAPEKQKALKPLLPRYELPEKMQGIGSVRKAFEDSPMLTAYLVKKFKDVLSKAA